MARAPFILLVNPWITDFAAYDLWAKPMGLYMLAALLREGGCGVALIDCLDRNDPSSQQYHLIPGKKGRYGTGKYPKVAIGRPPAYQDFPRTYFRYGIHPEQLVQRLQELPGVDLIWVTGIMTYWYPGIQETIQVLRRTCPETPIWLGGIYPRLCRNHAEVHCGADLIVTEPIERLPDLIEAATAFSLANRQLWGNMESIPDPAFDLSPSLDYVPLLTSFGCSFHCPYCASGILQPRWQRRSAESVYREVMKWSSRYGVKDFAFYDDALLIHAESSLKPALERICRENLEIRFHTPNAIHIRALDRSWCTLLYRSGFRTLRLGLETTRPERQRQWGNKVDMPMFEQAVENLYAAGFEPSRIGVYLLSGLPGQSPEEVIEAVDRVCQSGLYPYLAEYSPIPKTAMWPEAVAISPFDIEKEPLYHNNTFFACRRPDFSYQDLEELKLYCRQQRQRLARASGT